MIFGINFCPKQPDTNDMGLPLGYAKKFRKELKLDGLPRGHYYRLVGIAESKPEADAMLAQADNGHRKLHVEKRMTARGPLFGIYAY